MPGSASREFPALPEPFYYLHNFRAVLAWIGERYADLLDDQERAFIAAFAELPEASQACWCAW